MNSRIQLLLSVAVVLFVVAVSAPLQGANLLVDPGFESNPLNTAAFVINTPNPMNPGVWGAEMGTITGVDGGVTPAQGALMLRMTDDGQIATQTFQAVDVTSYAALIDSGSASYNLTALFNVDKDLSAALGGVYVSYFTNSNYSSLTSYDGSSLTLDNSPATWESISLSKPIPTGTRWLLARVAYNNASLIGTDGATHPGYVDAADLRIVPEPGILALLSTGLMGLLSLTWWRRK
jgi:hypothetical protein